MLWILQRVWYVFLTRQPMQCLTFCDVSEMQLLRITWLRYLLLMLLKHDFQLCNILSRVIRGNECFLKMQMPLAGGKRVGELVSYHFPFPLPCYLSPHPCRACWQELINLFMGWTELAPIIQGVERLNGGNKRLYPLPICPAVTLPSFQDSMKLFPICACNSCIQQSLGEKNKTEIFFLPNASFEYWPNSQSVCHEK